MACCNREKVSSMEEVAPTAASDSLDCLLLSVFDSEDCDVVLFPISCE